MQDDVARLKNIKIIFFSIGGVVVVLIAIWLIDLGKFHVVSTNPTTNQVAAISPFFIINFNKQLLNNESVSASPGIIRNYSVKGKAIVINLNYMNVGNNYFIDIKSVTATNKSVIKNKLFKFTVQNISEADLPKDQQQALINGQDHNPSLINNPITAHLPYSTSNWNISSEITRNQDNTPVLVLDATIDLSQVDMSNEDAAISGYKRDITNYIQSVGFNPNNYTINYTINTP